MGNKNQKRKAESPTLLKDNPSVRPPVNKVARNTHWGDLTGWGAIRTTIAVLGVFIAIFFTLQIFWLGCLLSWAAVCLIPLDESSPYNKAAQKNRSYIQVGLIMWCVISGVIILFLFNQYERVALDVQREEQADSRAIRETQATQNEVNDGVKQLLYYQQNKDIAARLEALFPLGHVMLYSNGKIVQTTHSLITNFAFTPGESKILFDSEDAIGIRFPGYQLKSGNQNIFSVAIPEVIFSKSNTNLEYMVVISEYSVGTILISNAPSGFVAAIGASGPRN